MRTSVLMRATCCAALLAATACGGGGEDDEGTSVTTTTSNPSTSTSTTTATTVTTPPTATTATATATTIANTTTTAAVGGGGSHAAANAEQSAQAALDALGGSDYTGTVTASAPEDVDDIVFAPCLDDGDFDLDQLDASSAASFDAKVQSGQRRGSLEVRAFTDADTAAAAYATLRKVLGTDEGRACFAAQAVGALGAPTAPTVEALSIVGTDVAARLTVALGGQKFFVDFVATTKGACTFFGSYQGIGQPFDPAVITRMFSAATA